MAPSSCGCSLRIHTHLCSRFCLLLTFVRTFPLTFGFALAFAFAFALLTFTRISRRMLVKRIVSSFQFASSIFLPVFIFLGICASSRTFAILAAMFGRFAYETSLLFNWKAIMLKVTTDSSLALAVLPVFAHYGPCRQWTGESCCVRSRRCIGCWRCFSHLGCPFLLDLLKLT